MIDQISVYTDGGVIGRNPSPEGGTWAYIMVPPQQFAIPGDWPGPMAGLVSWCKGVCVARDSGIVTPQDIGLEAVSNNLTELWATMEAMEILPERWAGTLLTDSGVTLCRLKNKNPSFKGIPAAVRDRFWAARQRLGNFAVTLLSGHPTKAHLVAGIGKRGTPCSKWNVECDHECGRLASAYKTAVAGTVAAPV